MIFPISRCHSRNGTISGASVHANARPLPQQLLEVRNTAVQLARICVGAAQPCVPAMEGHHASVSKATQPGAGACSITELVEAIGTTLQSALTINEVSKVSHTRLHRHRRKLPPCESRAISFFRCSTRTAACTLRGWQRCGTRTATKHRTRRLFPTIAQWRRLKEVGSITCRNGDPPF